MTGPAGHAHHGHEHSDNNLAQTVTSQVLKCYASLESYAGEAYTVVEACRLDGRESWFVPAVSSALGVFRAAIAAAGPQIALTAGDGPAPRP